MKLYAKKKFDHSAGGFRPNCFTAATLDDLRAALAEHPQLVAEIQAEALAQFADYLAEKSRYVSDEAAGGVRFAVERARQRAEKLRGRKDV